MEKFRGWVRAHPIAWVVGVFLVAGILGAAAGSSGESGLEDEKADLEMELARAEEQKESAREEARETVDQIEGEKQEILGKARGEAKKIVGDAKAEAEELDDVQSEIASAEGELANVEDSLVGAEEEKDLSSFSGGIMKGESDYTVGATYKSPGGAGCYWAMLNSANTNDISVNEFTGSPGQQIVTISTPYFTSSDCGTWERIE